MALLPNNELKALIPSEQPMGHEQGIISAAEAGRHLAILGSCVLALNNPSHDKHYYLATDAKVKKISNYFKPTKLYGTAKLVSFSKRSGVAYTKLATSDGQLLYTIEVTYKIMHVNLFEKLFEKNKILEPVNTTFENPYFNEIKFSNTTIKNTVLKTTLGSLKPSDCKGHFDNYPALPVAILMHSLSKAAGLLYASISNKEDFEYMVEEGLVSAENLAFVGNKISIIINHFENEHFNFICKAISDEGIEYGSMKLALRPHHEVKVHKQINVRVMSDMY